MYIKRLNIIISWILILVLMVHVCVTGYTFLFRNYIAMLVTGTAHLIITFISIHIVLCFTIAFFFHGGSSIDRSASVNKRVIVQRVTALLILLMTNRHVNDYHFIVAGVPISTWNKVLIIAAEFVFYASLVAHITASVSPSLMEYGLIDSKEKIKKVDTVVFAVGFILSGTTFFAITKYVIKFVGWQN